MFKFVLEFNFQGKPTVFLGPFPFKGTKVPLRSLL